jgi:hypothetical protein
LFLSTVPLRLPCGIFLYCGDETVPAPLLSLDKGWIPGVVAERVANIQDVTLEYFGLNERIGPQRFQKFILCNQAAAAFDKVAKDRERFGRKRDSLLATP